jgi:O-antigen biosynthesis protein WbqP
MTTKRFFDLILACMAGILLALPILVFALMVKITSPGPVLYWSERSGKNNKTFWMPKFRSMLSSTPPVATRDLANPDQHITPIGRFLRRNSLDELPQLWSILKGDMSFVGPRPVLLCEDDLIALRTRKKVHQLIPGLTGWAQINGRDYVPLPRKVALDVVYKQNQSFCFDIEIIWLTFIKVIHRHDVLH